MSYVGINEFVPQLQPFQPNLNFYSGVLATKQQQYDSSLSKLGSLYSSAFAQPMLGEDNIKRRDDYFKTIQQDIQKITKLDLSKNENITVAKKIFDPILNDKDIIKDMSFTKQAYNALEVGNRFRLCTDPNKCGGEFWNQGMQAVQYQMEEFKNASPKDRMSMQGPQYVPAQNVTKKSMDAAKAAGFNVSYDHTEGRYIVTDTNGQLLFGEHGDGVLPQYLLGMFGNDASIQNMYSTHAYVQRKNATNQIASERGITQDQAESEYLNNIIAQTTPKLEKSKADLAILKSKMTVDQKALEVQVNQQGGILPGDPAVDQYDRLMQLIEGVAPAEKYHENVTNLIHTAPNLNDLRQLRSRADNIVANGMFMDTIQKAAYDYAMGTAKHEMKADPYALAAYNNSLDLQKGIALQNHELGIWQQKEQYKSLHEDQSLKRRLGMVAGDSRDIDAFLSSKGVTPEALAEEGLSSNVRDWTKADFDKAGKLGLYNPGTGKTTDVNDLAGGVSTENSYIKNGKLVVDAVEDMKGSATNYLQQSFEAMRNQYFKPAGATQVEQDAVRAKILSNMTSILAGTGVSPESIINGSVKTDIFGKDISKFNKSIARAISLQEKDIASNVVTGQWSPDALLQYQKSKQVAEGLFTRRKNDHNEIMNDLRASLVTKYAENPEKLQKSAAILESMTDSYGMLGKDEAKERYVKAAKSLYNQLPIAGYAPEEFNWLLKQGGLDAREVEKKAGDDFDANWEANAKEYLGKVKSWYSKPGSTDTGGAESAEKSYSFSSNGDQKLSPEYTQFKNIVSELSNTYAVYGESGLPSLAQFKNSPAKQELADRLFQKYKNGDTKGLDVSYSLRAQNEVVVPKWKESPGGELERIPKGVFMNVTLSDETVRELYPERKTDKDWKSSPIPENMKSFTVEIPANKNTPIISNFVSQTTPSTTDVYMRQPGATLTQSLPAVGDYVITRGEDGLLKATGKFNTLDPITHLPVSREFVPETFDQDVTYDVAQSRWNRNMDMAKQRLDFLKKQVIALNQLENAGAAK